MILNNRATRWKSHRCFLRSSIPVGLSDWLLDRAYLLVPAQDYVAKFLQTFVAYPPRQKAASFSLKEVMEKLQAGSGSK